ncbi:MAG TPA: hypothetical protein VFH38_04665 [Jatrophihabitans sp.]|nr:hypothetical protein [Jatrophihabitans sp.]
MKRFTTGALVAAAGCLASALIPTAAQAAPDGSPWTGGGFVATPAHLRTVAMTVVVPELPCSASSDSQQLRIGMFGVKKEGTTTRPWSLAVVASCTGGVASYRARGMRVQPGDVVALSDQYGGGQESWEVDDRTSGRGEGGGEAVAGGQLRALPWGLVGGQLTGKLPAKIAVPVSGVRVDGKRLGNQPVRHRAQLRHGTPIVHAGRLDETGTGFTLRVG